MKNHRKTAVAAMFLFVLMALFACQEKKNKTSQEKVESEVSTQGAVEEKTRAERSGEYAGQIASGIYTEAWEAFDDTLSGQLSKEQLEASWKEVSGGLSGYEGIQSVTETTEGEYQVVLVEVAFGNAQARSIQFVYNAEEKIAGIWFDRAEYQGETKKEEITAKEMAFEVNSEVGALHGILTLPTRETTERAPVVLLFQNSDSDRDGTIGDGKSTPLKDVAKGLAEQGIASLRYPMRKYEYKEKNKSPDGWNEWFLKDASAAFNQIYTDNRIDKNKIILFGMGESSCYLSMLAKAKEKRIAGVVLVAPAPVYIGEKNYTTGESVVADANYYKKENSTLPLMVLWGESDRETTKEDIQKLREMWQGRSHMDYREYKKRNHYLMQENTGENYEKRGSVDRQAIRDISTWIWKQSGEK